MEFQTPQKYYAFEELSNDMKNIKFGFLMKKLQPKEEEHRLVILVCSATS